MKGYSGRRRNKMERASSISINIKICQCSTVLLKEVEVVI